MSDSKCNLSLFQYKESKTGKKNSPKRGLLRSLGVIRLAIAASIAVLLGVATFLWLPQQYSHFS